MRHAIPLAAALLVAGCGQVNMLGTTRTLAAEVKGLGDPLETSVTVSTRDYERPRLVTRGSADPSYVGILTKEGGEETFALFVRTNDRDWRHWSSVRIGFADGVETFDVARVGSDVSCHRRACDHVEDVVAMLTEEQVRRIAGADTVVTARLSGRGTMDMALSPDEAGVFLAAMDSARAALR